MSRRRALAAGIHPSNAAAHRPTAPSAQCGPPCAQYARLRRRWMKFEAADITPPPWVTNPTATAAARGISSRNNSRPTTRSRVDTGQSNSKASMNRPTSPSLEAFKKAKMERQVRLCAATPSGRPPVCGDGAVLSCCLGRCCYPARRVVLADCSFPTRLLHPAPLPPQPAWLLGWCLAVGFRSRRHAGRLPIGGVAASSGWRHGHSSSGATNLGTYVPPPHPRPCTPRSVPTRSTVAEASRSARCLPVHRRCRGARAA